MNQIKKIPNEAERLRLLIEVEKVGLLSEIAQGISFYQRASSRVVIGDQRGRHS